MSKRIENIFPIVTFDEMELIQTDSIRGINLTKKPKCKDRNIFFVCHFFELNYICLRWFLFTFQTCVHGMFFLLLLLRPVGYSTVSHSISLWFICRSTVRRREKIWITTTFLGSRTNRPNVFPELIYNKKVKLTRQNTTFSFIYVYVIRSMVWLCSRKHFALC